MKTLYLVRHAQAIKDDLLLPDRDRPLDAQGERDAAEMGRRLAERGARPDVILSSPARRALTTAQAIADALQYRREDIDEDERLYSRGADAFLSVIRDRGDNVNRVMLVGHNPEIAELAHRLSSEIIAMPTGAVAELEFDAKSWSDPARIEPVKVSLDHPQKDRQPTK